MGCDLKKCCCMSLATGLLWIATFGILYTYIFQIFLPGCVIFTEYLFFHSWNIVVNIILIFGVLKECTPLLIIFAFHAIQQSYFHLFELIAALKTELSKNFTLMSLKLLMILVFVYFFWVALSYRYQLLNDKVKKEEREEAERQLEPLTNGNGEPQPQAPVTQQDSQQEPLSTRPESSNL